MQSDSPKPSDPGCNAKIPEPYPGMLDDAFDSQDRSIDGAYFNSIRPADIRNLSKAIVMKADQVMHTPQYELFREIDDPWEMAYSRVTQCLFRYTDPDEFYDINKWFGTLGNCEIGNIQGVTGNRDTVTQCAIRHTILTAILDTKHLKAEPHIYMTNIMTLCRLLDNQVTLQPLQGLETRAGLECVENRVDPLLESPQNLLDYARYLYWYAQFMRAEKESDLPDNFCESGPTDPFYPCMCPIDYWLLKAKFCPHDLWETTLKKEFEVWCKFIIYRSCLDCQHKCMDPDGTQAILLHAFEKCSYFFEQTGDCDWVGKFRKLVDHLIMEQMETWDGQLEVKPIMTDDQVGMSDFNYKQLAIWTSACWICDAVHWHHENSNLRKAPFCDNESMLFQFAAMQMWILMVRDLETRLFGGRFTPSLAAVISWDKARFFYKGIDDFRPLGKVKVKILRKHMLAFDAIKRHLSTHQVAWESYNYMGTGQFERGEIFYMCDVTQPALRVQKLAGSTDRLTYVHEQWYRNDMEHRPAFFLDNDLEATPGVFRGNKCDYRWFAHIPHSDYMIQHHTFQPLTLYQQYADITMNYPGHFWKFYNEANHENALAKQKFRENMCNEDHLDLEMDGYDNETPFTETAQAYAPVNLMISKAKYMPGQSLPIITEKDTETPITVQSKQATWDTPFGNPTSPNLITVYHDSRDKCIGDGHLIVSRKRLHKEEGEQERREYIAKKMNEYDFNKYHIFEDMNEAKEEEISLRELYEQKKRGRWETAELIDQME